MFFTKNEKHLRAKRLDGDPPSLATLKPTTGLFYLFSLAYV